MNSIITLLELEITMFLLMIVGGYTRKKNLMTKEGQSSLSSVLLNVILPCNIFKSFLLELDANVWKDFAQILIICGVVMTVACVGGVFFFRNVPEDEQQLMRYGMVNGNVAFLGLPVCQELYGDAGILNATIYMIPHRILVWSYGMVILQGKNQGESRGKQLKSLLLNPCMFAAELGLICMLFQLKLPNVVQMTVEQLGKCLFPMSMLVIGSILSQIDLRTVLDRYTFQFCIFRLGLLPLTALLTGLLVHASGPVAGAAVALAGMPCASITAILAARFDLNQEFASKMIALATILSAVTIPVWNLAVRMIL